MTYLLWVASKLKMDLKRLIVRRLQGASNLILQDMRALPEEAFTKNFGEKVRTVADFVYETILVNDQIGMLVRGEDAFEWPEGDFIRAPKEFNNKADIITAFEKSSNAIVETYQAFSEEQLQEEVEIEGTKTTRFERGEFMALHMWYHSGQLNYIQTLLGDDAWHWA